LSYDNTPTPAPPPLSLHDALPISGDTLTEAGVAVGTLHYMSPEQASGERHVDGRADIYALGCVVYEMVAGVPPFQGATAESVLRSEEHTSELQSRFDLVCRLLLEK